MLSQGTGQSLNVSRTNLTKGTVEELTKKLTAVRWGEPSDYI